MHGPLALRLRQPASRKLEVPGGRAHSNAAPFNKTDFSALRLQGIDLFVFLHVWVKVRGKHPRRFTPLRDSEGREHLPSQSGLEQICTGSCLAAKSGTCQTAKNMLCQIADRVATTGRGSDDNTKIISPGDPSNYFSSP